MELRQFRLVGRGENDGTRGNPSITVKCTAAVSMFVLIFVSTVHGRGDILK